MSSQPSSRQLRSWLVLSRGSNLPTVWSNCLAGGWLGGYLPGVEPWGRLVVLLVGASALYTAGMFLNDVFDWQFDAQHRPERPIPAGLVARRAAAWTGAGMLTGGVLLLGSLGWQPLAWAVVLAGLIVLYDWVHKRTSAGLILMGGCRLLLYPLASAASSLPVLGAAAGEGLLLASYVFGLSALARGEHLPDRRPPRWPWWFIALPVVANAFLAARVELGRAIVVALPLFWLGRVAFGRTAPLGRGRVAALLAGIVLFDLGAVAACAPVLPWPGWFAILFALTLLFQRFVPAT